MTESTLGDLRQLETWGYTGSDGLLRVEITPEPGETALLATSVPSDPSQKAHLRELILPGRNVAYDALVEIGGDRKRSNAGYVSDVATLNWPIAPTDAVLVPGESHTLVFGITDEALSYEPGWLQTTVLLKSDPDPGQGTLGIDLVYFGSAGEDPTLRVGVDGALERMAELFSGAGITLDISQRTLGGDILPPPSGEGAELWTWIAQTGPPGRVRVVVSNEGGSFDVVGVAGDVPAPLVPTGRTGVHVVPLRLCGVDGECDVGEQRMFGEVLAHEVSHHLGLFHPVETSWEDWDALSDTVECMGAASCEEGLGRNLMFPYPVCTSQGCLPLSEISSQQVAVLNGYVGVD